MKKSLLLGSLVCLFVVGALATGTWAQEYLNAPCSLAKDFGVSPAQRPGPDWFIFIELDESAFPPSPPYAQVPDSDILDVYWAQSDEPSNSGVCKFVAGEDDECECDECCI